MVFAFPPEIVVAADVDADLNLVLVPPLHVDNDEESIPLPVICVWRVSLDHALRDSPLHQRRWSYVPSSTQFQIPGYYEESEPTIPHRQLADRDQGNLHSNI
jgi:hypothetical protein